MTVGSTANSFTDLANSFTDLDIPSADGRQRRSCSTCSFKGVQQVSEVPDGQV